MENKNSNTNMISYFLCIVSSILKKWRFIVLVVCFCCLSFDVYKTLSYKPVYSARGVVAIVDSNSKGLSYEDAKNAQTSIQYLMNSQYMKNIVNELMKQDSFDGELVMNLTPDTNLCTVEVCSSLQSTAYFELMHLIDEYNLLSQNSHFGYKLSFVENISFTNMPLNNNSHIQNYKYGFIVSLILCIVILSLKSYFKDNIKTYEDVNDKVDARLYARIPKVLKRNQKWGLLSRKKQALLVTKFQTAFSYVEAMNKFASKVETSCKKRQYQSILITSSLENEGKSTIAVNLALSLAKNKHKVLLIDTDFRKPALHKIFEKEGSYSIVDLLNQQYSWKDIVVSMKKEHIDVIFSKTEDVPNDFYNQIHFEKIIEEMKKEYDYIVIDSAPSFYIPDTLNIAGYVDATFIVVKQNEASAKIINDTIYRLMNASGHVIGTIYNGSVYNPLKTQSVYGYRYGYYRYRKERG